jgi:hypothetical protein
MRKLDRLERQTVVYKNAFGPLAALTYLGYEWMASNLVAVLRESFKSVPELKTSLTELVELVQQVIQSDNQLSASDKSTLQTFVDKSQSVLSRLDKFSNPTQITPEYVNELQQFMGEVGWLQSGAYSVATILKNRESWYAQLGSFLVGQLGFGMELTDVRKAQARAGEIAAAIGVLLSKLETQMQAAQQTKAEPAESKPEPALAEFAGLTI